MHGFCLNYGLPFPGAELLPTELASDPLRNAAFYSMANGYINSNAFDVEKAIWYLSDGTRLDGQDYTLADEIVAYANSGVQPADVVDGVPHMVELVTAGSLEASVSGFVNIAPETGVLLWQRYLDDHQRQPEAAAVCGLLRHRDGGRNRWRPAEHAGLPVAARARDHDTPGHGWPAAG